MASSSDEALDGSFPEMVYKSSLIDETTGKRDDPILKCPVCNHYSRFFYCVDCIRSGNFTHSKKKCFDRFADKKPKKFSLEEEKNELIGKYSEIRDRRVKAENIRSSIIQHREKISLLRKCIEARKKEREEDAKNKNIFQEESLERRARNEKKHQEISKLKEKTAQSESKRNEIATKLSSVISALEEKSQLWICELRNSIFPIEKTPYVPKNEVSTEEGECAELEEAQKTTYVQGQWVIAGSPVDNFQFAVVGTLVPSTGDYSSYTDWCATHEPLPYIKMELKDEKTKRHFDVAYGITAGLSYASQLVNVIARYLDVHLPQKSSFNDFCQIEEVSKFHHQVAKLNANIIHLCLQRQVDVFKLSAHRTISNLQLVFDPQAYESLQVLSLQEKEDLLESLEDSICKDLLSGDESDDDVEADFEYITNDEVPKADSPAAVSLSREENIPEQSRPLESVESDSEAFSDCEIISLEELFLQNPENENVSLSHENLYEGNIPEQSSHLESEESDSEAFSDCELISLEEVLLQNPGNENLGIMEENRELACDDLCGLDQNVKMGGASNSEEVPDIPASGIVDGVYSLWTSASTYLYSK